MNRAVSLLGFFLLASVATAEKPDTILGSYLTSDNPQAPLAALVKQSGAREALLLAFPASQGRERTRIVVALCMLLKAPELTSQLTALADQDPLSARVFASALEARLHRHLDRPPQALAKVVEQLGAHADWHLRLQAARLARCLQPASISRTHHALLKDSVWPVRCLALESLAAVPAEEALPILEPILRDRQTFHVSERLSAARALSQMQHVPSLLLGLADPDRDVRFEVLAALDHCPKLPDQAMLALKETLATCQDDMVKGTIQEILEKHK